MIVKIQRPLMTNGDEPMALIYNQSKTHMVHVPLSTVESMFEEGEQKIYAKARMVGTTLHIRSKTEPRDW